MLILSDPHFGKTGHFRKAGIHVPQQSYKEDLLRLFELTQFFKPEHLLITGDLFHSSYNKEVDLFFQWRKYLKHLPVILVKGNHDILSKRVYQKEGIIVYDSHWCVENFCFTHDVSTIDSDHYIFSGHIHPAVKIRGLGKQVLRLPCFYFSHQYAVLPAFGNFTGNATIHPDENDHVFAITKQEVIDLSGSAN